MNGRIVLDILNIRKNRAALELGIAIGMKEKDHYILCKKFSDMDKYLSDYTGIDKYKYEKTNTILFLLFYNYIFSLCGVANSNN